MKKTGKRAFSLLIAIFLLVTMLPRLQLPAVAAWEGTREQDAVVTQPCLGCGSTHTTYKLGTVTGHDYVDGVCTVSNQELTVASGTCGANLSWRLNSLGALIISGTGPMDGYSVPEGSEFPDTPWYAYRLLINKIVIESGVTSIGKLAFYNCTNLTEVSIPEGVTEIGSAAFRNCSSLTGITIPEGVTNIGMIVFYDCTALTEVTIGAGVAEIGGYAFGKCTALKRITFLGSAPALDSTCFVNVTASVCYPCNDESWIATVKQGYGGKPTWEASHNYVNGMCAICQDELVEILYSGDFGTNLQWQLDSTGTLTISGIGSMKNCSREDGGAASINTPWYWHRLLITKVVIQEGVTTIGASAFGDCYNVTEVTIPESITAIKEHAFEQCSSLSQLTLPKGITIIDDYVFNGCINLSSLTIPESVTEIGYSTFSKCTSLADITIPQKVTYIDHYAFSECTNLKSITFLGSAPTIDIMAFPGVTATVYHPCSDPTWTDEVKRNYWGKLTWISHVFSDYVVYQDATCTQNAMATGTCPDCGATGTVAVPGTATGHSYARDGLCRHCSKGLEISINVRDSTVDAWADSYSGGVEVYVDDVLLTTINNPRNPITIPYTPSSTYTFKWRNGSNVRYLLYKIGMNGKVFVYAQGSSYSDGEIIYRLEGSCQHQYEVVTTLPTCTADGTEISTCSICGSTREKTIPATGHSYQQGVWITQTSCTVEGKMSYTCSNCGHIKYDTFPATGHDYEITMVPVTCTDYGYELHACQNCDSIFYNQVTPPTGHKYVDGKCECGDVLLQGDITGDGKINMGDVSKLYAAVRGKTQLDEATQPLADLNGDGKINMGDVAKLYRDLRAKDSSSPLS